MGSPVALVTGAAGGLGGAIAHALGGAGFDLLLNDLAEDAALHALCGELEDWGVRASLLPQDLSRVDELPAFVERAQAVFGSLDCLVNNAGVSVMSRGDVLDVSQASFDRCVAVNLRAPSS